MTGWKKGGLLRRGLNFEVVDSFVDSADVVKLLFEMIALFASLLHVDGLSHEMSWHIH